MKTITIIIGSQQKGFFLSIAKQLSKNYKIFLLVQDKDIYDLANKLLDNVEITILPNFTKYEKFTSEEFEFFEKKYSINLSMIASYDRALGEGYIFNIDNNPVIFRSYWNQEAKYSVILTAIKFYEKFFLKNNSSLILSISLDNLITIVADNLKINFFSIGITKFGDYVFWHDILEYRSTIQNKMLNEYLENYNDLKNTIVPEYEIEQSAFIINSAVKFTLSNILKKTCVLILKDIYKAFTNRRKKNSYKLFSWSFVNFKSFFIFKFLEMNGKKIKDLENKKIVYSPLQVEPEISMLWLSPEFNNSMEMITWISKSLPSDYVIVLKEHVTCIGIRSIKFYKKLLRIPNVVLAHPEISSWNWIKKSEFVTTITGTVGIEAVYMSKPVLSFGYHQLINCLPTVFYADNYMSTKKSIEKIFDTIGSDNFDLSKKILYKTQKSIGFRLNSYKSGWDSKDLVIDDANVAIQNLFDCHLKGKL